MNSIKRIDLEDAKELASITQHGWQFENPSVALYELAGEWYAVEDTGSDKNYYLLDADERNQKPQEIVNDMANDWANNGECDSTIEVCLWGLSDPSDFAIADDYQGECKIIVEGQFYGPYNPTDYAKDEEGDTLTFTTKEEAQEWIDEQTSGDYYTAHNEAGRPSYTIIEA